MIGRIPSICPTLSPKKLQLYDMNLNIFKPFSFHSMLGKLSLTPLNSFTCRSIKWLKSDQLLYIGLS